MYGREVEQARLLAFVSAIQGGRGGVGVLVGPAGVGKSTLLRDAHRRAEAQGTTVLRARAAEVEQNSPLGVARQLLQRRNGRTGPGLLTDADRPRMVVFDDLYWELVDLAAEGPVLLSVDDIQWADNPSREWLDFLSRRLEDLPVGVLVATRAATEFPFTTMPELILHLPPLPLPVLAAWVDAEFAEGTPRFVAELSSVTGGNAFLVTELLRVIKDEHLRPDDDSAGRLAGLTPAGVATSVLLRLGGAGPAALAVTHALAALQRGSTQVIAAVAGMSAETALEAIDDLRSRDLVGRAEPVEFVHPLVRSVIYEQMPLATRERMHSAAAAELHRGRSEPDAIGAHLLRTSAPLPAWALDVLTAAAESAVATGGPATAAEYLRRAARSAPDDQSLQLRLGAALAAAGSAEAGQVLRPLISRAPTEADRVLAAVTLSRAERYAGAGFAAVRELQDLRGSLSDPQRWADVLDMELLGCLAVSADARRYLTQWRRALIAAPPTGRSREWQAMVAATTALDGGLDGAPRTAVLDRAATALDLAGGTPPEIAGIIQSLVGLARLVVGDFGGADTVLGALVEATRSPALAERHAGMLAQHASVLQWQGDLRGASAEAQAAFEWHRTVGGGGAITLLPRAAAVLVAVAAEQGTAPPAATLTDDLDPDSIALRLLAFSRAELLLAEGRFGAAAAGFARYGAVNVELGWQGVASPWRSRLARSLVRQHQRDRAPELVAEERDIAERSAVPAAIGIAIREQAWIGRRLGITAPADELDLLVQAAASLQSSGSRLEHAWALYDLGRAHHRADQPRDAARALREAGRLAEYCDGRRLLHRVTTELRALGVRRVARPVARQDLTRAEQVAARHAADGLTNRQIARSLFVTEKTVEAHLRAAFAKLGVTRRGQLANALAARGH